MNIRVTWATFTLALMPAGVQAQIPEGAIPREPSQSEIILDLQGRIDALEKQVRALTAERHGRSASETAPRALDGQSASRAQAVPSTQPSTASSLAADKPASEKAHLEDETARALERALVREGGFLLPPGSVEVEPRLQYTYRGTRGLGIVSLPDGAQVADRSEHEDRYEASIGIRVGLPWESQAEIRVPYLRSEARNSVGALNISERENHSGRGDAELQFTKQFARERRGVPALLGSVNWRFASGDFQPGRVSAGTGFPSLQVGLTAVKRDDPLVLFGGLSYTWFRARSYDNNHIEPGQGFGVRFGTMLAASPDTSLRAALSLNRHREARLNDRYVPGSDSVSGVVELGLATLLDRRTLLDFTVGFGITSDAPDVRIGLSIPIKFD